MKIFLKSNVIAARLIVIVILSTLMTACGGGGGDSTEEGSSTLSNGSTSNGSTSNGSNTGSTDNSSNTISLAWNAPLFEENGDPISSNKIESYEIKYKKKTASEYASFTTGGDTMTAELTIDGTGEYEFIISATDINGQKSAYTAPIYRIFG